jgi:hypothetical protein
MDISTLPRTREEARRTNAKYYFTGEPCKHGHIAPRKTKGACLECLKTHWKESAVKREDYFADYNRKRHVREKKHEWYLKNKDKVIEAANIRPAEIKRIYRNTWKQNNLVKIRADAKARRRKHRQATPGWLTRTERTEIRQIYQIAITLSKSTNTQYVVDHIVPLRSEEVCGLHVPWNLRVITREENLIKSNKIL